MQINGLKVAVPADAATIGANALAGWGWITQVEGVLQIALTVVGIGAGIASWRWYRAQRKALEKKDE